MASKKEKPALSKVSKTGGRARRRKATGASTGLTATELQAAAPPGEVANLHRFVESNSGKVLAVYREPYHGQWVMLAALPIDQVEPTPFQRNLSATHVRKLETVIGKLEHFLDPIIAVRAKADSVHGPKYWTPNGHHRLSAMRTLGAKTIVALLVPQASIGYRILALNTEKAHNLRERAMEVIKMCRDLAAMSSDPEEQYALEFEDPALITLGLCYEQRPRFSGGAYHPVLKRVDTFLKTALPQALAFREKLAATVLALDDVVIQRVEALKARGLTSPYLKSFVVARINPLRFRAKEGAPLSLQDTLARMQSAAQKFNPEKITVEDLARSGGAPTEEE